MPRRFLIAAVAVACLWTFGGVEAPSVTVSADTNCGDPGNCANNGTGHRPSKKKVTPGGNGNHCKSVWVCTVVFTESGEVETNCQWHSPTSC